MRDDAPRRSQPATAPHPTQGPGAVQDPRTLQRPPSAPGPLLVPGRRLDPSPLGDRRLRRVTTLVGAGIVLLVVLGLALASTTTWLAGRGFTAVPATTGLGTPSSLILTSGTGTVRALPSGAVDELTLALVAPGSTTLPAADAQVPAKVTRTARAEGTRVEVHQPGRSFDPPWSDGTQDVLLLVPTDLDLALEVHAGVGDVLVDGEFTALEVHADVGDLRLGPLSAPGGVSATVATGDIELELGSPAPAAVDLTTAIGDIDVLLPTDAEGRVSLASDLGDIRVAAPGTARWEVRADSELGEVRTEPGLAGGTGETVGTLTATTDLGNVDITR